MSDQEKPVVGGSNALWYGIGIEGQVARDFLVPWVTYGLTESNQLLVEAKVGPNLSEDLSQDEILEIAQVVENWEPGVLGIEFAIFGGEKDSNLLFGLFELLGAQAAGLRRFAKNLLWELPEDPLVLDLNGDGLISYGVNSAGGTFFDNDGDYFAEATGWISGDDGFLVHDADGSGTIDDVSELFSLAELGITALSANGTEANIQTASGTTIRSESFFIDRSSQVKAFTCLSNDNDTIFDRVVV